MPFIALESLRMVDAFDLETPMARNATHQTLSVEFANEACALAPLRISQQIQYDSLTEQFHDALLGNRLTPSIFQSKRPSEQWAVMFLGSIVSSASTMSLATR